MKKGVKLLAIALFGIMASVGFSACEKSDYKHPMYNTKDK